MSHATKLQRFGVALALPFAVATTTLPAITPQEAHANEAMYQQYIASESVFMDAARASRGAQNLGVVVSTNTEQERVQSANVIAEQVCSYLTNHGVSNRVVTEAGTSFGGVNELAVCIDGRCNKFPLTVLNKEFLNKVIEDHVRTAGKL